MIVRKLSQQDQSSLVPLIADFRVELAALKGHQPLADLDSARCELIEVLEEGWKIYNAQGADGILLGYIACRVVEDVVWIEQLYVLPEFRRQGIASALFAEAERLVKNLGGDNLYNWVHPNNSDIIQFLKNRGYTVLNLIEVRKKRPGEVPSQLIAVGEYEFDY